MRRGRTAAALCLGLVAAAFPGLLPPAPPLRPSWIQDARAPELLATIELPAILNRHWTAAPLELPSGRAYLSLQFGPDGEPYVAVLAQGAGAPRFFPLRVGLSGEWEHDGRRRSLSLSPRPWDRLASRLALREGGAAGEITLRELLERTFAAGAAAGEGRIFYYNEILPDGSGPDPSRFGLAWAEKGPGGTPVLRRFRREDVAADAPVRYRLEDGRSVYFRARRDFSALEVYGEAKKL